MARVLNSRDQNAQVAALELSVPVVSPAALGVRKLPMKLHFYLCFL
jgi:hypothetical protein